MERHFKGPLSVPNDWTDNGDRLAQVCLDQKLYPMYTNFVVKSEIGSTDNLLRLHTVTFRLTPLRSNTSGTGQSRIFDHPDPHHDLFCAHFCLSKGRGHTNIKTTYPIRLITDDNHQLHLWSELSTKLPSQSNAQDPGKLLKEALHVEANATQDPRSGTFHKEWIFRNSTALLNVLTFIRRLLHTMRCVNPQESADQELQKWL